jgi:hypothetical protein
MIYLEKNKINKVILTLKESSILTNPLYTFEFTSEFNGFKIYIAIPNESQNLCRYDLFNIQLDDNGLVIDCVDSPINLESGQYEYRVFETIDGSIYREELALLKPIEIGRMCVAIDYDYPTTVDDNEYY